MQNIIPILIGVCIMFMIVCGVAFGEEFIPDEIADAIFMAEGGYGADYLYGIRSIPYEDEAEARQICINSIRNNYKRWDKQGDFLEFMSRRYCPIGADNDTGTNKYWVKNVKYFLQQND